MKDDSEDELEPASGLAWVNGEAINIQTNEIFACFKSAGNDEEEEYEEYVSLLELHLSGTPIDTETDDEMDLASEDVFRKTEDGKYLAI